MQELHDWWAAREYTARGCRILALDSFGIEQRRDVYDEL
jgi:hypothetical protein